MPGESRADQALRNARLIIEHHKRHPNIPMEYLIAQGICHGIGQVFQKVGETLPTLHVEGMKRAHYKWAVEATQELQERARMEAESREHSLVAGDKPADGDSVGLPT